MNLNQTAVVSDSFSYNGCQYVIEFNENEKNIRTYDVSFRKEDSNALVKLTVEEKIVGEFAKTRYSFSVDNMDEDDNYDNRFNALAVQLAVDDCVRNNLTCRITTVFDSKQFNRSDDTKNALSGLLTVGKMTFGKKTSPEIVKGITEAIKKGEKIPNLPEGTSVKLVVERDSDLFTNHQPLLPKEFWDKVDATPERISKQQQRPQVNQNQAENGWFREAVAYLFGWFDALIDTVSGWFTAKGNAEGNAEQVL